MEPLKLTEETIALGKKLVAEFSHNDRIPMTARWMAHYLAGLIVKAEGEPDPVLKMGYDNECAAFIVDLWKNREYLPEGARPLAKFQEILPVLEALVDSDPQEPYWQTFRQFEDGSSWGRFLHKTRLYNEDIFRIILCSVVTKRLIDEEKDWLKFPHLISESERNIIEHLELLLNRQTDRVKIIFTSPGEDPVPETKYEADMPSVFKKLEQLMKEQQQSLAQLKRSILGNNGGTDL